MNTTTPLICTECGEGNLEQYGYVGSMAQCTHCGQMLNIARDIAPCADDAVVVRPVTVIITAVTA